MNDRTAARSRHPFQMSEADGTLVISGYDAIRAKDCICFVAEGSHFHQYGIADHSLLLVSTSASVSNGDLVVCFEDGHPRVCLYTRSKKNTTEKIPTVHTKKEIYGKVLGSFNLYD